MIPSLLDVALGIAITLSAFAFHRTDPDRLLVSSLLGPVIVISSAIALRYRKASYVAAVVGFLLAGESMMEGTHGFALPSDMLLGMLVMAIGLYPHSDVWAEGPPTSDLF